MKKEIFWNIFINTQDKAKAERINKNLMDLIGHECHVIKMEKYWKDDKLFNIELMQSVIAESPNVFVFELLGILSIISRTWSLSIPTNFNKEDFDFSGITNEGIKLNGIHWINFAIE